MIIEVRVSYSLKALTDTILATINCHWHASMIDTEHFLCLETFYICSML